MWWFKKKKRTVIELPEQEKQTVRDFAGGDSSLLEEIRTIYSSHLGKPENRTIEFKFLSEVFNPCPDVTLRARYRDQILRG